LLKKPNKSSIFAMAMKRFDHGLISHSFAAV
jgi:hypothetical protein